MGAEEAAVGAEEVGFGVEIVDARIQVAEEHVMHLRLHSAGEEKDGEKQQCCESGMYGGIENSQARENCSHHDRHKGIEAIGSGVLRQGVDFFRCFAFPHDASEYFCGKYSGVYVPNNGRKTRGFGRVFFGRLGAARKWFDINGEIRRGSAVMTFPNVWSSGLAGGLYIQEPVPVRPDHTCETNGRFLLNVLVAVEKEARAGLIDVSDKCTESKMNAVFSIVDKAGRVVGDEDVDTREIRECGFDLVLFEEIVARGLVSPGA